MNLLSFIEAFPDESSCREYLRRKREEARIVCSRVEEPNIIGFSLPSDVAMQEVRLTQGPAFQDGHGVE